MEKEQNCPNCKDSIYLTYSKSDLKRKFPFANSKIAEFENSIIYKCLKCSTSWYDHKEFDSVYSVEEEKLDQLLAWCSKNHQLKENLFSKLKEIGATPTNEWGHQNQIEFPCKCVLNNDTEIDFCLIRFQILPPFLNFTDYEKVVSVNDVKDLKISDFALNNSIRKKTVDAEEIRNGFAPTPVKDPNDNYYILNWTKNFFDMNGISGSLLQYAKKHPHEKDMIYDNSEISITYIIGDWKEKFLSLI